ncbi:MAG: hypothetical protein K5752_09710 [Succinivibrionaceae bacterium]|nr:hypothetical protein [Succinivibrionaceae bacterium]
MFISTIFSVVFSLVQGAYPVDPVDNKLEGTWISSVRYDDYPREKMHFKRGKVKLENMTEHDVTVKYDVSEKNADYFTVVFEYSYKKKKGNGHIVDRTDHWEMRYHEENGTPIISSMIMELDGRGLIVAQEYLRKENFVDGFVSKLKHTLNDRNIPSTSSYLERE